MKEVKLIPKGHTEPEDVNKIASKICSLQQVDFQEDRCLELIEVITSFVKRDYILGESTLKVRITHYCYPPLSLVLSYLEDNYTSELVQTH